MWSAGKWVLIVLLVLAAAFVPTRARGDDL